MSETYASLYGRIGASVAATDNAPVSPIATQEAAGVTTLKAEVEELKRERDDWKGLYDAAILRGKEFVTRAERAESRLASFTGQVEDTAREKLAAWMIQHSMATGHGDTLDDLLGELSAYVQKMQADRVPSPISHRLLADAVVSRDERIASLTGQVEDMRERAAKVRGWFTDYIASDLDDSAADGVTVGMVLQGSARDALWHLDKLIRALPVLPTTGDGGGPEPEDRK